MTECEGVQGPPGQPEIRACENCGGSVVMASGFAHICNLGEEELMSSENDEIYRASQAVLVSCYDAAVA